MIKKIATYIIAITFIMFGASMESFAAKELKLTSCLPASTDPTYLLVKHFVDPSKSSKNITINFLGGPEVTPGNRQGESLKRGIVDLVFCPASYYSGILREGKLIGAQNISLHEINKNGGWDLMQQAWSTMNARVIAWTHSPGQDFYIYTNKLPAFSEKTGIDLSGFKIRSTPTYKSSLVALGATPINISSTDTFTALQRGVIDGVVWTGNLTKNGWADHLKYRINVPFFGSTRLLIINNKTYNSLSAEETKDLKLLANSYYEKASSDILEMAMKHEEELKKRNIIFLELSEIQKVNYLNTIYISKWAENDAISGYVVDYHLLKSKLYRPD